MALMLMTGYGSSPRALTISAQNASSPTWYGWLLIWPTMVKPRSHHRSWIKRIPDGIIELVADTQETREMGECACHHDG